MSDPPRWARLSALLDRALELPPEGRVELLAAERAADATLGLELEELLAAAEREGPLSRDVVDLAAPLLPGSEAFGRPGGGRPGERVGPYRLLSELGRGGMGAVWLAERTDGQFEQRVALKLVKRGMDSDEILRRFLAERRILARLQHDAIARLYDGGAAEDGTPWFALEHVTGEPLIEWASRRSLPTPARLELVEQVCAAVQYAHRNLVVHRDLKPSNVLVTDTGKVKLLDFGIAKILDDDAEASTRTEHRLMTPEYAAPEQLAGGVVTTSTDVWALGVLTHELLTGRRPEPGGDPPSRRAAALAAIGPPTVARSLPRDLRQILARALAPEPDRRYPSAEALAEDLARFRRGEPVRAHRGSAGYRLAKFVRRHRAAVVAAAAVAAALVVGLGVALRQTATARREASRARAVTDFLLGTFAEARPEVARGIETTAREILEKGSARLASELAGEPELRAELGGVVASIYYELGAYDRALGLLETSEAPLTEAPEARSARLLLRARALSGLDRLAEAQTAADAAIEVSRRFHGESDDRTVRARVERERIRALRGDTAPAIERLEALTGATPRGSAARPLAREALAEALFAAERFEEAAALRRAALVESRRRHGEDSLPTAEAALALAFCEHELRRHDAARELAASALETRRRQLGPEHPESLDAQNLLGSIELWAERYDEARRWLEEGLALAAGAYGESRGIVASYHNLLGVLEQWQRRPAAAEAHYRAALAIWTATMGDGHPSTQLARANLATLLTAEGRAREAVPLFEAGLAQLDRGEAGVERETSLALRGYGEALRAEGRFEEALVALERASRLLERVGGPYHWARADALRARAEVHLERGDAGDATAARELLERALATLGDDLAGVERLRARLRAVQARALAASDGGRVGTALSSEPDRH